MQCKLMNVLYLRGFVHGASMAVSAKPSRAAYSYGANVFGSNIALSIWRQAAVDIETSLQQLATATRQPLITITAPGYLLCLVIPICVFVMPVETTMC